jgi:hypothetical protein
MSEAPKRHFIIPDTQCRPGVPLDHLDWCARAIVEYKPDVVLHLGDHYDLPSLSKHESPGSAFMEGKRVHEDLAVGNEAFARLAAPMQQEIARSKRTKKPWTPECHFLLGNHENRITRAALENPKLGGFLTLEALKVPAPFVTHPYLEIVELGGVAYSHFFSSFHSGKPLSGSVESRLNRIGRSFWQGHQQGFRYSVVEYPGGIRRHGGVSGSYYQHKESYRDAQSHGEWVGCVVLNEVVAGDFCVMPLSLSYLRRRFS